MAEDFDRAWTFSQLKQSLRALAEPGAAALATQPNAYSKADELAADYNSSMRAALECFPHDFSDAQRAALLVVETALAEMGGPGDTDVWTDEAVLSDPAWNRTRMLAAQALSLLGWEGSPYTWNDGLKPKGRPT